MADKKDFVDKLVRQQLFGKKTDTPSGGRRTSTLDRRVSSPMPRGLERRSSNARRLVERDIGAARQVARDIRAAAVSGGSDTAAIDRARITGAPARTPRPDLLPKREWVRATEALPRASAVKKSAGILNKAGKWGKLGAMALGGYAAYKAWKNE